MTRAVDPSTTAVYVDGGTTNTRLWLVADGNPVARHSAMTGVRDVARGDRGKFETGLRTGIDEVVRAGRSAGLPPPERLVAAGMIASELGLGEVPHVESPASAHHIAAAARIIRAPAVTDFEVVLVPGVRTGGNIDHPRDVGATDAMRGEETLCLGLMELGMLPPGGALYNLGSHWKIVQTDNDRRISSSTTSLTGELIHAIQSDTILASSVPAQRPTELDEEWVAAGTQEAETAGLPRALFCVRLLEQRCESTPEQRLSFLVGAVLTSELAPLLRGGTVSPRTPVVIAGGGAAPEAVGTILGRHGITATVLSAQEAEQAMIAGLQTIAALLT